MPRVGFEPTISAGERPKTYALDRAATGIGKIKVNLSLCKPWKHKEDWRYGATHKLSSCRRYVVSFHALAVLHAGKNRSFPLNSWLRRHHSPSVWLEEQQNPWFLPEIKSRFLGRPASSLVTVWIMPRKYKKIRTSAYIHLDKIRSPYTVFTY